MKHLLLNTTIAVGLTLATSASHAASVPGRFEAGASGIHESWVYETGSVTISTDNLEPGCDTVLHLIEERTPGNDVEVAFNDDHGGLASRITHTLSAGKSYYVVAHAYSPDRACYGDLRVNGAVQDEHVFFGGGSVDVLAGPQDEILVIPMKQYDDGILDTVLYAFGPNVGQEMLYDDDHGIGRSAKVTVPAGVDVYHVVVGTYSDSTDTDSDSVLVVVNDAANDMDGDGLGASLEGAVGTCDYSGQISECENGAARSCLPGSGGMYSLLDSDGDGIGDAHEVLGKDAPTSGYTNNGVLYLPMWGAEPAQKDMFIEVDYFETSGGAGNPAIQMTATQATDIADVFDVPGTASSLQNPNGEDGIRVHLDTGRTPVSGHSTVYGDWGGANQLNVTAPGSDPYGVPVDPSDTTTGAPQMEDTRKSIFHYMQLTNPGAGACASIGSTISPCPPNRTHTCIHEKGHNLSLQHHGVNAAGPQNAKPHYQSVMNYAYTWDSPIEFSSGQLPTLDPEALVEDVGLYTNAPDVLGRIQAGSQFNYTTAPPSDTGTGYTGIDWNRDGVISDASNPVRAAVHITYSAEVDASRFYRYRDSLAFKNLGFPNRNHPTHADFQDLPRPVLGTTPSMSRFEDYFVIGYVDRDENQLVLLYTADGFRIDKHKSKDWGKALWEANYYGAVDPTVGPAIASVFDDEDREYLVVVHGSVRTDRWEVQVFDSILGHVVATGTLGTEPAGHPVLSYDGDDLVAMWLEAPVSAASRPVMSTFDATSRSFGAPVDQVDDGGLWGTSSAVTTVSAMASEPTGGLRAVVAENLGSHSPNLHYAWYEYTGNDTWTLIGRDMVRNATNGGYATVQSTPALTALAYADDPANLAGGGRWYSVFGQQDGGDPTSGIARVNMTRGHGGADDNFLGHSYFDNWYIKARGGSGFRMYSHAPGHGVEESPRMVMVFDNALEFRPFADGIVDWLLEDVDDWAVMSQSLCRATTGSCTHAYCTPAGTNLCDQWEY